MLLVHFSPPTLSSFNRPNIVRTRNAEIRAEKFAAARAYADSPTTNNTSFSSLPNTNSNGISLSSTPMPDETSFISSSRAPSANLSPLEQRALEMEKRQAWRQARLQSMDVESKRTDEVIKLITSIPPSPIPIQ